MSRSERVVAHAGAQERDEAESLALTVSRLYRLHRNDVHRLALRYGSGNEAWAEDIVQDVFITLLDHLPRLQDRGDLGGWIYRVTTNRCFRRLRRERFLERPWVRHCLSLFEPAPDASEAQIFARHDLERTRTALACLPVQQRIVVCMRHLDGKSQVEIGEILGLSKSYVCKLLSRGTARLQKELS